MRYLSSTITFSEPNNMALEASNWDALAEKLSIKYLLHNESFFSMINIDDDDDINGLLKTSKADSFRILLFVT